MSVGLQQRGGIEPDLDDLRDLVRAAGFTPGISWENERVAYAFSVESWGPATYGHPKFTASYNREVGWLQWTGGGQKIK